MQNHLKFIAALAVIFTAPLVKAEPSAFEMFHFLDSNADSKITLLEYKAGGGDADELSWAEELDSVCTEHALQAAEQGLVESFKSIDKNTSKSISLQEFITTGNDAYSEYLLISFDNADSNKDEKLSAMEYQQQANQMLIQLEKALKNSNSIPTECVAEMGYWAEYYLESAYYTETIFGYLDDNQDAYLAFAEYLGLHLLDK